LITEGKEVLEKGRGLMEGADGDGKKQDADGDDEGERRLLFSKGFGMVKDVVVADKEKLECETLWLS
jgi:hypothetical protein